MADVFFLIAGLCAIAAAITGGRFGLFRPDLTLIGATDLLGLVATVLIAWLLLFDFPAGADREIGAFLALIGAIDDRRRRRRLPAAARRFLVSEGALAAASRCRVALQLLRIPPASARRLRGARLCCS